MSTIVEQWRVGRRQHRGEAKLHATRGKILAVEPNALLAFPSVCVECKSTGSSRQDVLEHANWRARDVGFMQVGKLNTS